MALRAVGLSCDSNLSPPPDVISTRSGRRRISLKLLMQVAAVVFLSPPPPPPDSPKTLAFSFVLLLLGPPCLYQINGGVSYLAYNSQKLLEEGQLGLLCRSHPRGQGMLCQLSC